MVRWYQIGTSGNSVKIQIASRFSIVLSHFLMYRLLVSNRNTILYYARGGVYLGTISPYLPSIRKLKSAALAFVLCTHLVCKNNKTFCYQLVAGAEKCVWRHKPFCHCFRKSNAVLPAGPHFHVNIKFNCATRKALKCNRIRHVFRYAHMFVCRKHAFIAFEAAT